MVNQRQKSIRMEDIPLIKLLLFNQRSKLEINRVFMPIKSTLLPINDDDSFEEIIQQPSDKHKLLSKQDIRFLTQHYRQIKNANEDIRSTSRENGINNIALPSKTQQIINPIDHRRLPVVAYNHKHHDSLSSVNNDEQQQVSIDEHQPTSSEVPIEHLIITSTKTDILSPVIRVEQPLSPPLSQLFPDSIINDKQATKRIFNEINSTHLSKHIALTPIYSLQKNFSKSLSNNYHSYEIGGSILSSTSTFIMHKNEVIAQATPNPFLSDTIFIILIATLTIIILLFCLGLFCLCRRTTKRNISPSFDGGSYTGLNEHSFDQPIRNYQQRLSKYENNIPYITDISSPSIQTRESINHPSPLMNDRILLPQTVALHHTAKQKAKMSKNKLKKKRIGFCCCNSKQISSTTVNARTRIQRNEI